MKRTRFGPSPQQRRTSDYLSRLQRMEEEVSFKLQYLHTLRTQMPAPSPGERVTGGDTADSTAHRAIKIAELQQEITHLYEQMDAVRREIEMLIRSLPDLRLRSLLEMRYLSGFKWETIAETMFMTPRSAMRLHQRALQTAHILLTERRALS